MDSSRWQKMQSLFHEAADLPDSERRDFLEAKCADDPALVDEVLMLLQEDSRGASLLDRDIAHVAHQIFHDPSSESPPFKEFGPYRIIKKLGEGGMGVVYLAEREDLGSQVAVKILRDAWLSPARRARFAAEQRTLAQLNHPSIARLYDADTSPDGTPFFVMEYVEGVPLTIFAGTHSCTVAERLRLFREVCEAVLYAHQHAVIHRDLKPSNILVKDDGPSGCSISASPSKSRVWGFRRANHYWFASDDPGLCRAGTNPRRTSRNSGGRIFAGRCSVRVARRRVCHLICPSSLRRKPKKF